MDTRSSLTAEKARRIIYKYCKGKPTERWGRKATDPKQDSGVTMSQGNSERTPQLRMAVNPASAERARDDYLSAQQAIAVNMLSVRMYSRRLRAVEDFVLMHLDEELTIDRVADHVHLSPDYFSRYFHDTTGVRFSRWIAELRIEMAKKLLETSGEPITTIAFLSGFSSLSSFERSFKRLEGRTARAYRRSLESVSDRIDRNRRF